MNVARSYFLLFIFLTNSGNINYVWCKMRSSTLDRIILALYRDVHFMYKRPEQINVDAIFGLNLAQVHVRGVLEHKNASFLTKENRHLLEELIRFCEIARNNGKNFVKASRLETMILPEVWNRTIFWRFGELGEKPWMSAGLTRAKASSLFYQGTPLEAESLRCFLDLLSRDENLVCKISKKCTEMITRKDFPRGYPLTHRILYVQLARALGCQGYPPESLETVKMNFCANVLQDLVDLEWMNFPSCSMDLVMEQIAVCGMEGYREFSTAHYAKLIASWPNSHGCFSAFGFVRGERKSRRKRSTSQMDYGCDTHASGVAAASLALLVRSAVENKDPEFFEITI